MLKMKHGFTLVEIMIVVAIIAALAAIAVPNLLRARIQGNESAAQATLKTIATALESYYMVNTRYPTDTTPLIGVAPPYLTVDYFSGTHNGYSFTPTLTDYTYSITAAPADANFGTSSYTISTGAVLQKNP